MGEFIISYGVGIVNSYIMFIEVSVMVQEGCYICPNCGGVLKRYDKVRRYLRLGGGVRKMIFLHRYKCSKCGKVHRGITNDVIPYKQYSAVVIFGFISGRLSVDMLKYEDYPCELTVRLWHTRIVQVAL